MVRFAVAACAVRRAGIAARNRTTQTQFRVSQAAIAPYTTPAMWRRIPVPTPAMFPSAVVAPLVDGKRFFTPSPINSASGPFEREASDSVLIASGPIDSAWAKTQPTAYYDMDNETLLLFCAAGDFPARKERLIREIMAVDDVSWDDAHLTLWKIDADNAKSMWFFTIPYKVGIATGVTAAVASIPMVFDLDTALWFNEHYVTAEVADEKDLETWLEVGGWTWGWNEPVLGTLSFVLLALQYARNQMVNLGARPYTEWLKSWRANRLCKQYPKYSSQIVADFADADDFKADHGGCKGTDVGYYAKHSKHWI